MTADTQISSTKPTNPFAHLYASFKNQTEDHQLTVVREDGIYRHLRMRTPGTSMWGWDILTWPGFLATTGDIGAGMTFTRLEDMLLNFFAPTKYDQAYFSDGAPSIDFRYWAEKLIGNTNHVRIYDNQALPRRVREHLQETETYGEEAQEFYERQMTLLKHLFTLRGLTEADLDDALQEIRDAKQAVDRAPSVRTLVRYDSVANEQSKLDAAEAKLWRTESLTDEQFNELLEKFDYYELSGTTPAETEPKVAIEELVSEASSHCENEHIAYTWLRDNEQRLEAYDTWEWSLRTYDSSFVLACYAINHTVQLYLEHLEQEAAAAQQVKPAPPTHLPAALLNQIEDQIPSSDYSVYVLDGQQPTPDQQWHDALVIEERDGGLTIRKFTQSPEGRIEHHTVATAEH